MINVSNLLNSLTLEEKVCLLSGHRSWFTNSVSRVGLQPITLTDGPHGLRLRKAEDKSKGLGETELSTCFPAASTTACSWNKELLYSMGEAMGKECRHYGVNLILGPAVNIKRNPLCGRNFEYFSEDPLIAGELGAALTRGIEDMGVGTSVKHFACNNKEANRYYGDVVIDERAFREIYLRAFEPIIKEGRPQTVMCSYNKINGTYASENHELLNQILRDDWGFEGLVMSDWGAVNDRVEGLKCGLDLEMPGDVSYNRQVILDAVNSGYLSLDVLDNAVRRVLNMIYNCTINSGRMDGAFDEHALLAKKIAIESAVLMKNDDNVLPLSDSEKYLVVGEMFEKMRYQGAGSSLIRPYKLTTPKAAFDSNGVNYEYLKGYNVDSFDDSAELINQLSTVIDKYDKVIFFGGLSEYAESEGFDRTTMSLPENQINIINLLAKANKKIVFVMFGGSPVDMTFDNSVSAILNMYLPGESGGEAAYELLFGKANPSGRLAETWPVSYSDVPFADEFVNNIQDRYKESIFVGYRYYTHFSVPVKYPFGFGLSYTDYSYTNMRTEVYEGSLRVYVDVKNVGSFDGSSVLEIYVKSPDLAIVNPVRQLCGFNKVFLRSGEQKTVCIEFSLDRLKHYINGRWVLENGDYTLELCEDAVTPILASAIELSCGVTVNADSKYNKLYKTDKATFLNMTDDAYDTIIDGEITPLVIKRPYDLNTPMKDYKTLGGKFLYKAFMFGFKLSYLIEKSAKESPDKETKVKNAYFTWRTISVMNLRSISYGSEGRLSHKLACALLDVANNHPFKAIARILKADKHLKLPD